MVLLPDQQSSPVDSQNGGIEPVDAEQVCMVNDRHYQGPHAVPVGEKTYYGCCQGCVAKLNRSPAVRTATDPVTGKTVDKATAIIGALPDGTVHYFESEKTLARYDPSLETN